MGASAVSAVTPVKAVEAGSRRFLNLHEYQSKDLMESFGAKVQNGKMAATAKEAGAVARAIRARNPKAELILKAQIHAGGRGKGHFDNGFKGGVKICDTPEQASNNSNIDAQAMSSAVVSSDCSK